MKEITWFLTIISDYHSKKTWDLKKVGTYVSRVEFAPLDIRLIQSKMGASLGLTLYHGYTITGGTWIRFTPYLQTKDEALSYVFSDFYSVLLEELEDNWKNKCPIKEFYSYETIEKSSVYEYKKSSVYPGTPCSLLTDEELYDYSNMVPNYPHVLAVPINVGKIYM